MADGERRAVARFPHVVTEGVAAVGRDPPFDVALNPPELGEDQVGLHTGKAEVIAGARRGEESGGRLVVAPGRPFAGEAQLPAGLMPPLAGGAPLHLALSLGFPVVETQRVLGFRNGLGASFNLTWIHKFPAR